MKEIEDYEPIQEIGQPIPEDYPDSYNECLYCGDPVLAPAMYCCEEHEEHRSMR